MPLSPVVHFLRERARRLREIAGTHATPLSQELCAMARDLEMRADELERTNRPDSGRAD